MCPAHKVGYCSDNIMVSVNILHFTGFQRFDCMKHWKYPSPEMWCHVVWSRQQYFRSTYCLYLPSSYSVILKMEAAAYWQSPHIISEVPHMATTHRNWYQECGNTVEHGWTPSVSAAQGKLKTSLSHACWCPLQTSYDRWGTNMHSCLTLWQWMSHTSTHMTQNEVSQCKVSSQKLSRKDFSCDTLVLELFYTYCDKPLFETMQPAHHHSQCCCNMALSYFKPMQHLVTIIMTISCCRTGTSLHCLTRMITGLQPMNCHSTV
jgi:hypothetical protein